jgi:hypothetical protein
MDKYNRYVREVNILPKKEERRRSGGLNGKKIIMNGVMGRGYIKQDTASAGLFLPTAR